MSFPAQTFASTDEATSDFNSNNVFDEGEPIPKYTEPRPDYTIIKSKQEAIRILRILNRKREALLQFAAGRSHSGRTYTKTQRSFAENYLVRVEKKLKHLKLFIRSRDQLDEAVEKLVNDKNLQGARAIAAMYNQIAAPKF